MNTSTAEDVRNVAKSSDSPLWVISSSRAVFLIFGFGAGLFPVQSLLSAAGFSLPFPGMTQWPWLLFCWAFAAPVSLFAFWRAASPLTPIRCYQDRMEFQHLLVSAWQASLMPGEITAIRTVPHSDPEVGHLLIELQLTPAAYQRLAEEKLWEERDANRYCVCYFLQDSAPKVRQTAQKIADWARVNVSE